MMSAWHAMALGDDVLQEQQRRLIRPVQVVEDEHERLFARGLAQQADDRSQEQVALGVGIGLDAVAGASARRSSKRRHEACQLAAVALDVGTKHLLGSVLDVVGERLDPGAVGHVPAPRPSARRARPRLGSAPRGRCGSKGASCRSPARPEISARRRSPRSPREQLRQALALGWRARRTRPAASPEGGAAAAARALPRRVAPRRPRPRRPAREVPSTRARPPT